MQKRPKTGAIQDAVAHSPGLGKIHEPMDPTALAPTLLALVPTIGDTIMTDDLLFVYGTLKRGSGNAMAGRLARTADFLSEGTYQGRLYLVDDYPGAVPSGDVADQVRGEVWRLRKPSAILAELDEYEGCGQSFSPPTEYERRMEQVTLNNGERVAAWIYLYCHSTDGLRRIESGVFVVGPFASDDSRASRFPRDF